MKLRYETGIATMIQFVVIMFLGFIIGILTVVKGCQDSTTAFDCVTGSAVPLIWIILLALWFGFLAVLGYAAQDKRDHRLAFLLMGAEFLVFGVAVFNAKHHNDATSFVELGNSLIDAVLAAWIMLLAFRLTRAKGGRITSTARATARRRPVHKA